MECRDCGTTLTEFNATSFRHVHDIGNCAQVLMAQRDKARREAESLTARLALADAVVEAARKALHEPHLDAVGCRWCQVLREYDAAKARETE